MWMMFGWEKLAAMRASLRNIDTKLGSDVNFGWSFFSTTLRLKSPAPRWFARNTSPIPPVASFEMTS